MKKFMAMALAATFALAFACCSSSDDDDFSSKTTQTETETTSKDTVPTSGVATVTADFYLSDFMLKYFVPSYTYSYASDVEIGDFSLQTPERVKVNDSISLTKMTVSFTPTLTTTSNETMYINLSLKRNDTEYDGSTNFVFMYAGISSTIQDGVSHGAVSYSNPLFQCFWSKDSTDIAEYMKDLNHSVEATIKYNKGKSQKITDDATQSEVVSSINDGIQRWLNGAELW